MARIRVSTTVDGELLAQARGLRRGATDSALLDEALRALVARHRAGEIDAAYRPRTTSTRSTSPTSGAIWRRSATRPRRRDGAAQAGRGLVVGAPRGRPPSRRRPLAGCGHPTVAAGPRRSLHHDDPWASERGRARTGRRPRPPAQRRQPGLGRKRLRRRARRDGWACCSGLRIREICAALDVAVDCGAVMFGRSNPAIAGRHRLRAPVRGPNDREWDKQEGRFLVHPIGRPEVRRQGVGHALHAAIPADDDGAGARGRDGRLLPGEEPRHR